MIHTWLDLLKPHNEIAPDHIALITPIRDLAGLDGFRERARGHAADFCTTSFN